MNTREEQYHMTAKEMARLRVIERVVEGEMKVEEASRILNISTRQVIRIKKGVKEIGPKAVIHGNRKRKPVNATKDNVKDLVVELKKDKYCSTNFSHFAELISEDEKMSLSRPTIHSKSGINHVRRVRYTDSRDVIATINKELVGLVITFDTEISVRGALVKYNLPAVGRVLVKISAIVDLES